MKYFLHDSNSFNDEKITELFINFGYEGVGLFYTALEKFAYQEKPIKTSVLKSQLKIGKKLEKCWRFMEEIGLISSNNGETFNKQLLNYSQKYKIKKEKNKEKISEWRKNQALAENVTSYEPFCNHPKVKESKLKESKVIKLEIISNVFLTDIEFEKIKVEFQSDYELALKKLSNYKNSSGKKYKSDYHALIGWVKDQIEKEKNSAKKENYGNSKNQSSIEAIRNW